MRVRWNDGTAYLVPFVELRFQCPCANCVDEHSGVRILRRDQVAADVRPTDVQLVGRYAIRMQWSDGHSTGIYHYDTLFHICAKLGQKLP